MSRNNKKGTLLSIMYQAGLNKEEFLGLLKGSRIFFKQHCVMRREATDIYVEGNRIVIEKTA